uniref:BPI2 domain-containing protein n=1 Tax=Angiostrongylus cantonensis TaxID=6313 RepID=A0A0K0DH12_ANGCA
MAEFFATDYIANSMLYHAYRQHLMDVVVGPESSPQLKGLLSTSCSSTFCIGEYLGTLGEQYPDREVEIVFTARKAPLIVFIEDRARFRLHGRMNMYVRPNNETQVKEMIIRSDTTMTANVNMWLNGTRIIGNATIENLDFRLLETKASIKDVDQASFGDLGLFGAEFLEKLLTEILQLGITMPTMLGVQLKSPRLTFHERYLRVQTYFKLDERFTSELFQKAVRQTLNHVG